MALGLWPCKFFSTNPPLARKSGGLCRTLIPNSAIILIADTVPFKALKFSVVLKNFKGQAAGKESFETKDALAQNSMESNAPSNQSILQGDNEILRQLSMAKDAEEALSIIANKLQGGGGCSIVGSHDCAVIIGAALARNNVDLAFSILHAMRRNSIQTKLQQKLGEGNISDSSIQTWRWAQPDVTTYTTLVRGLAASLRVSDAIQTIKDISRVGAPPEDEVPFGKVVKCPNCMIALAVVQPQHGIQLVSCSKCRYQYELMTGDIVNIESESIRMSSLANAAQTFQ